MACRTFCVLASRIQIMKRIILVFAASLVAISGVSCTVKHEETAYLGRAEDWVNSLSFTLAGLKVDEYQNTVYSKYAIRSKASQLEPYLRRLGSSIKKTTPPSGLVDVHRQLESLVADVIELTANLRQVLTMDNAPVYYFTPERRTELTYEYPENIEDIFEEHEILREQIDDLRAVITTELKQAAK